MFLPPLNYLSTEEDRRVAVEGIRFTRRIMAAPALSKYRPAELKPGPDLNSTADLMHAAAELGTTIFHPVGTCKMGNDPMAVVNDRRSPWPPNPEHGHEILLVSPERGLRRSGKYD